MAHYSQEMSLYDQLGPLARAAVRDAERDIQLPAAVAQFMQDHRKINDEGFAQYPDLKSVEGDKALAAYIQKRCAPLKGKPIPVHAREAMRYGWGGR